MGAAKELHLVRDVLDKRLLGNDDCPVGRVDGIVLDCPAGRPPRVRALAVGSATLFRRVGRLGRWLAGMLGRRLHEPHLIEWKRVQDVDLDVHTDVDPARHSVTRTERWVRDHIASRVPGSSS